MAERERVNDAVDEASERPEEAAVRNRPNATSGRPGPMRTEVGAVGSDTVAAAVSIALEQIGIARDGIMHVDGAFLDALDSAEQWDEEDEVARAVAAYLAPRELRERCSQWLQEGLAVLAVVSRSISVRGQVAEIIAEMGGRVLGPGGKTFPEPENEVETVSSAPGRGAVRQLAFPVPPIPESG